MGAQYIGTSECQGLDDQYQTVGACSSQGQSDDRVTRAYMLRQRPLYHNCQLRAPDGQLLCTCDVKKAEWYIEKGLGEKVSDDPLTIQLTFEPSGRPVNEKNYYLQDKDNKCVVCGSEESYIRKNIVPHEYRKHFPSMMKEHRSHDVVLMCSACHQQTGLYDSVIKDHLAEECQAPIGATDDTKFKLDNSLQKVKSAAKALLNSRAKIPEERRAELSDVIRLYYGTDIVNDALLHQAMDLDTKLPNNSYIPHGQKVVRHFIENDGLIKLERIWRQHFLDTMKPGHLPSLWSVDHSHNELTDMDEMLRNTINS